MWLASTASRCSRIAAARRSDRPWSPCPAAAAAGHGDHGLSERRAAAIREHREAVLANHTVMTCREDLQIDEAVGAAGGAPDPGALRALATRHGLEQGVSRLLLSLIHI